MHNIRFYNRDKGIIGKYLSDFNYYDRQKIINILEDENNRSLHLRLYCINNFSTGYYYRLVFGKYKVIYACMGFKEMYDFINYIGIDMSKVLMPTNFTLADMFNYMYFEDKRKDRF